MRKIDVIVAHERLIEINEIIHKHKVGGMTFYNIKGRGRSKLEPVDSDKGILRHTPEFQTRIKCEILVSEHMIRPIVDEILKVIRKKLSENGGSVVSAGGGAESEDSE